MATNNGDEMIEDHQAELTVLIPGGDVDPGKRVVDLFDSTCGKCDQPLGKHASVQMTFHRGYTLKALDNHHLQP